MQSQQAATGYGVPGGEAAPPAGYEGGHFNQITQRWERPSERPETVATQGASTMPDADGSRGPSFKDQVNGFAKKFAGKLTGKDHEVTLGDSLLAGQGKGTALSNAEAVKQQQGR